MPRAPSEKSIEAKALYQKGMKQVDIAKKLGVPEGTIRRWKHDQDWDNKSKKKQSERSEKNNTEKANVRKRKGGQIGNINAKGGAGNPNPKKRISPDAAIKHGGYVPVFMDALDEDEQELVEIVPTDEEQLLIEQIQLFSIRERRILQAINKYRNTKEPVAINTTLRSEKKRVFDKDEDKLKYEEMVNKEINEGKRKPGRDYNTTTTTENKDNIIIRLEQELSSVQNKKTKAIEALAKVRAERAKIENETAGNHAVDDWIAAVLGDGGEENE